MEKVKGNHGGARPGAGRKKSALSQRVGFKLSPQAADNLSAYCAERKVSKSGTVNRLIVEHL
jgi:hypothetical protein